MSSERLQVRHQWCCCLLVVPGLLQFVFLHASKSTLRRLTPHRQLKVLHFTLIFNYFCRAFILCPHGACIALPVFNSPLLLSLISSLDFLFTLCCAFILNQSLFVSAGKKWKPKADPRSKAGSLLADEINCSRAKKNKIYIYTYQTGR